MYSWILMFCSVLNSHSTLYIKLFQNDFFFYQKQTKSSTFRFFSLFWHFLDFDIYLYFDMPNCNRERAAGLTDRQRMLTPCRHLILPLSIRRSVSLCFEFVFPFYGFLRWLTLRYCLFFHLWCCLHVYNKIKPSERNLESC